MSVSIEGMQNSIQILHDRLTLIIAAPTFATTDVKSNGGASSVEAVPFASSSWSVESEPTDSAASVAARLRVVALADLPLRVVEEPLLALAAAKANSSIIGPAFSSPFAVVNIPLPLPLMLPPPFCCVCLLAICAMNVASIRWNP
jgi:hypothetical protein